MADKRDIRPRNGAAPARDKRADVDRFLEKVAEVPARGGGTRGRLMFAMDATASREPTWDRACHLQGEMFEAADAVGGLEVQLVFYRGFGECKATPWVSNAADLMRRMTAVQCLGGQTQIGRVLSHAVKETRRKKVDALVFVGDCMEEDVDALCHSAGELGLLGVPMFIFHEGDDTVAARTFRQLAKLTKGACCNFDSGSADQLRDLLSAVAVYAAGGRKALDKLSRDRGGAVKLLTNAMDS